MTATATAKSFEFKQPIALSPAFSIVRTEGASKFSATAQDRAKAALAEAKAEYQSAARAALKEENYDGFSLSLTGKTFSELSVRQQRVLLQMIRDMADGRISPQMLLAANADSPETAPRQW